MVIIGTPNDGPNEACCNKLDLQPSSLAPLVCAQSQDIVTDEADLDTLALELGTVISQEQIAPISTVNGTSVFSRQRAISVVQGQSATIVWDLHNQAGVAIDLTPLATDPDIAVVLRLREQISANNAKAIIEEVEMGVVTAEVGKVSGIMPVTMTNCPGVYYAEVAVVNTLTTPVTLLFANVFSLIISRGSFGADTQGGPPSIAEIRLHLRDSSPAESFLLDTLMFDDAEIALAIARPVMYWNEIPPPIQTFNTQTFPFRYHWLEGICANLFMMVAEQFRRNNLDYSAGGISVADQNKEQNYERAAQVRWTAYREWVRLKKAEINLEGCWGSVGSQYSSYGRY